MGKAQEKYATQHGDLRAFSVTGPAVCNNLPVDLRSPDISEDLFRYNLKTFLFHTNSASAAYANLACYE